MFVPVWELVKSYETQRRVWEGLPSCLPATPQIVYIPCKFSVSVNLVSTLTSLGPGPLEAETR